MSELPSGRERRGGEGVGVLLTMFLSTTAGCCCCAYDSISTRLKETIPAPVMLAVPKKTDKMHDD